MKVHLFAYSFSVPYISLGSGEGCDNAADILLSNAILFRLEKGFE